MGKSKNKILDCKEGFKELINKILWETAKKEFRNVDP